MILSIAGPMVVPNLAMNGMIAITISGEAALTSRARIRRAAGLMMLGFSSAAITKA